MNNELQIFEDLYSDFITEEHMPFVCNIDDEGITEASIGTGAFLLEEPFCIKEHKPSVIVKKLTTLNKNQNQYLIRSIIPYNIMTKCISNKNFGYFYLSVLKNTMMLKLGNVVDLNKLEKLHIKRPGSTGKIFLESSSFAGVEFRIWAKEK